MGIQRNGCFIGTSGWLVEVVKVPEVESETLLL